MTLYLLDRVARSNLNLNGYTLHDEITLSHRASLQICTDARSLIIISCNAHKFLFV